ncbi:MAG: sigma-70 family RNA polymerase sigma factor [Bacteroidota bacterium]
MEENTDAKGVCDSGVFDQLFLKLAPLLRNFLYYRTGSEAAADDLVQEAFLRLWNNCAKVLPEAAKAFVFRVANNLFLNQKQHEKVVLKFQQYQVRQKLTAASPEAILEEQEFKHRLEAAIAALPTGAREVFLLNRMEKMKYREIAELLGISQKAVEKRMHRALVELRKLYPKI